MLKITSAEFITSAADEKGFLKSEKPVIAVAGKSNVGKSTFINMLANRNKLAKTSNTPGRTRLVNYFDFGAFVLADLPGYGFAQVSKTEKEKWGKTMDAFFARQTSIAHVLLLADIRHNPTAEDLQMASFLHHYAIPFTVVCNKSDQLGKTRIKTRAKEVANAFALGEGNVIAISAEKRVGTEKILELLTTVLQRFSEEPYVEEEETEI